MDPQPLLIKMGANGIELENLLLGFQFFFKDLMHLFFKFLLGQGANVIQYEGPPLNFGSLAIFYKNWHEFHLIGNPLLKL